MRFEKPEEYKKPEPRAWPSKEDRDDHLSNGYVLSESVKSLIAQRGPHPRSVDPVFVWVMANLPELAQEFHYGAAAILGSPWERLDAWARVHFGGVLEPALRCALAYEIQRGIERHHGGRGDKAPPSSPFKDYAEQLQWEDATAKTQRGNGDSESWMRRIAIAAGAKIGLGPQDMPKARTVVFAPTPSRPPQAPAPKGE